MVLWALPALGLLSPLLAIVATKANKGGWAFLFTSLTIACVILTCGVTMFPFVMPSSTFPDVSLTMWDATSSLFTLQVMTVVAIISFTPFGVTGKCTVASIRNLSKAIIIVFTKEHRVCGILHGFSAHSSLVVLRLSQDWLMSMLKLKKLQKVKNNVG